MTFSTFKIYDGSNPTESGTLTLNGTMAVVGASTAFTTQLVVGDVIEAGGEARVVATITDSTHLTVSTAFTISGGGKAYTIAALKNVETLVAYLLPPASDFQPYSKPTALGDGTVRGLGWTTALWKWGWLTQAQRNALKALCAGVSVETFIATRNSDGAFKVYRAVLVWPDREDHYGGKVLNFTLQFRKLQALE